MKAIILLFIGSCASKAIEQKAVRFGEGCSLGEEMPRTGTSLDIIDGDEYVEDTLVQLSNNNRLLVEASARVNNRRSHLRLQDFLKDKVLPSAREKQGDRAFEAEALGIEDAVHDLTDDITDQIQEADYSADDLEASFIGTKNRKQKKAAKKVEKKVEKKESKKAADENASVEDENGHYPFLFGQSK